jgi:hypothetical protein
LLGHVIFSNRIWWGDNWKHYHEASLVCGVHVAQFDPRRDACALKYALFDGSANDFLLWNLFVMSGFVLKEIFLLVEL